MNSLFVLEEGIYMVRGRDDFSSAVDRTPPAAEY